MALFGALWVLVILGVIHLSVDWFFGLWAVGFLSNIIVLGCHREIVKWLKRRITYPRTGYVDLDEWPEPSDNDEGWDWTIRRDPLSGRDFTTLSINKPPEHAPAPKETEVYVSRNIRDRSAVVARKVAIWTAWLSSIVIQFPFLHTAFITAAAPWAFAVVLVLAAIGCLKESSMIARAQALVLAVSGVAVATWPLARNHWWELLIVLLLGKGTLLLLQGTIALLGYLRRNPLLPA